MNFKTGIAIVAASALIGVPAAMSGRVPIDLKGSGGSVRPPVPGIILNVNPTSYIERTRVGCLAELSIGSNMSSYSVFGIGVSSSFYGPFTFTEATWPGYSDDTQTPYNIKIRVARGDNFVYVRYPNNELGIASAMQYIYCP